MAALTCDICGGKLVMGTGGVAVCDSCGMEHSKDRMQEKIQEIKGTVEVSNIANLESLMKRGNLALEDGKYGEANGYFDKVLDINPEYAPAYAGKLCAELSTKCNIFSFLKNDLFISEFKKEADLARCYKPLDSLRDDIKTYYQKAIRFADDAYRARLEGYNNEIKKRLEELKEEYPFYMIINRHEYHQVVKKRIGIVELIDEKAHWTINGICLVENPSGWLKIKILRTGAEYDIVYNEKENGYPIEADQPGSNDIRDGDIAVTTGELLRKKEQEIKDYDRREEQRKEKLRRDQQEREEQERREREQKEKWAADGLCRYCGGKLSLIGKKCKSCGLEN